MFQSLTQASARLSLGLLTVLVLAGAGEPSAPVLAPERVVICSVADVKGKTSPCGCHIPKGGLARQASFMDSIRTQYGQTFFVDAGGFFPEDDLHRDAAGFLMDAYHVLGADAVGVGDRDLRFGIAFLRENARARGVPMVCANLVEKATGKPVFASLAMVSKGRVKVGFFGLISDKVDLGPSRDSLTARDPVAAARTAVAELRRKGADVVVALSDLGKVDSEDLAAELDGIDVIVVARATPMIQKGRLVRNTMTVCGGEQGQYIGRTLVTLDGARKVSAVDAEVIMLGPEIPDQPTMYRMVKQFEDGLNERLRHAQKVEAARQALTSVEDTPDHFVGATMCERCHPAETAQWRTTAHARAWKTLVDNQRDADPECVKCHVVGYQKPGGFQTATLSPTMTDVQCEVCHGMGTQHEAYSRSPARVTEATCRQCHNETTSPEFSFAVFQPHILHQPPATLPPLPRKPGMRKVLGLDAR